MAIDLGLDDGFTPYLKFNAKAGRWLVKHEDADVEIDKPTLAFDFDNMKTGWFAYVPGAGPRMVLDTEKGRQAKPADIGEIAYKRGFIVNVYGQEPRDELDGEALGVRELSSTALVARRCIGAMYKEFGRQKQKHKGKLPVFACRGVTVVKGKNGDSFEPKMALLTWIARPEAMKANGADDPDDAIDDLLDGDRIPEEAKAAANY